MDVDETRHHGLWQVQARHEQDLDRWYLWLDLRIIARTIPALVTQPGR